MSVTDAEAKAYYDAHQGDFQRFAQVKILGIFVNAAPGIGAKEDANAKGRATEARRRVLAGEEFGKVARDVSEDMSKGKGGDLGWMDASFVASIGAQLGSDVSQLEPGETSPVLRGKFGYWVFQVEAKRPAGPVPFDEIQDVILKKMHENKVNEAASGHRQGAACQGDHRGARPGREGRPVVDRTHAAPTDAVPVARWCRVSSSLVPSLGRQSSCCTRADSANGRFLRHSNHPHIPPEAGACNRCNTVS